MPDPNAIGDDELLLRHIPGGIRFQNPPNKPITSENCRLRAGETGLSVTRASMTTAEELMRRVGGDPERGSIVASVKVADILALGLTVVSVPLPDDPGHAEIRNGSASLEDHGIRQRLAVLLRPK